MKAQNNPIDIGPDEIAVHKDSVESLFVDYFYQNQSHALPELITGLDPEEKYIMNDTERGTYITLRESFQVFKSVYKLLADKTDLKQKIIASPDATKDPAIDLLRGFCGNYATFSASVYAHKKLDELLSQSGIDDEFEKLDLCQIKLQTQIQEEVLIKRLLAPIVVNLIKHQKEYGVFKNRNEFPAYCRDIFAHYVGLAKQQSATYRGFLQHLSGYRFRIMDSYVALESYEDVSLPSAAVAQVSTASFQPIQAQDIVGNRLAKTKILRYIDRLALYDPEQEHNPILELGGLSWTNLFDGPPGTGKSSLFRLAMTCLVQRCEQVGRQHQIITVDQSIKDEFYGKTGKILLEKLNQTHNTQSLSLVIFDDIDLLTSTRSDAQGADNDINNIIMQYLDGVFTVRRGNVINFAASNKPTGLDSAMRNRFSDRLLVDGPVTAEDFADMLHIVGKKMLKQKLITMDNAYEPFATQNATQSNNTGDDVAGYMAEQLRRYKKASIHDFGKFMFELKQQNELITGRSTKAIMDAILERSARFDIPEDWFTDKNVYFNKSYDHKVAMLRDLYQPITPDVLFQEAQRYFDSEQRYAQTEAVEEIVRRKNSLKWDTQAQLEYYRSETEQLGAPPQRSAVSELHKVKTELSRYLSDK
ncbi:MAG: ATP-binding protein [Gammaproteobacteria bacterium]|nr:ATP-binding protein [Gammaproteobacteria bacterium]MDH5802743.1 ATP-binding protein [Gammaproteobacteria bacterium]